MPKHFHAKILCTLFDRIKDGRRYVVGVNIDRHGNIHGLANF